MRLMTHDGMRLVGAGLLPTSLGGVAVTRLIAFALYGVSPLDVTTWKLALLTMAVAGFVATLVRSRAPGHTREPVDRHSGGVSNRTDTIHAVKDRGLSLEHSMAHTHEYDCKLCGAHLDSRQELEQHNRQHHPGSQSDQSRSASSSSNSSSSNRSSDRS